MNLISTIFIIVTVHLQFAARQSSRIDAIHDACQDVPTVQIFHLRMCDNTGQPGTTTHICTCAIVSFFLFWDCLVSPDDTRQLRQPQNRGFSLACGLSEDAKNFAISEILRVCV